MAEAAARSLNVANGDDSDQNHAERRSQENAQGAASSSPSSPTSGSNHLLNELLYCFSSFQAIVTPVSITMILSALAVVYINTDETRAEGEAAYAQTYQVLELEEGNSTQNFGASVANVMIMVSVICAMTFVIVVLYKYGCMKIFLGYMVMVTALLLGYFTSNIALVAIEKYSIRFDKISFAYLIWNYAIVGVLAIFFNNGIPKFVTQGYLVTSSVVLAWQLSYFDDWTAWTLLVMLALYDLFAVLSPYGPLQKLTQLMSRPGARPLPGLLYEANLPTGVQRPSRSPAGNSNDQQDEATTTNENTTVDTQREPTRPTMSVEHGAPVSREEGFSPHVVNNRTPHENEQRSISVQQNCPQQQLNENLRTTSQLPQRQEESTTDFLDEQVPQPVMSRQGKIALAIAKLYKLPVVDIDGVLETPRRQRNCGIEYTTEQVLEMEWTPRQLRSEVQVTFPDRGGRVVPAEDQDSDEGKKFHVFNRNNELIRTFVVNKKGKVMQVVRREIDSTIEPDDNTIKLGLGDFIFYSVLVSKAALQSFPSFIGCMLTILFGLGATLVLLAVHGKALPALPISIFLAVIVFVLTTYFGEPMIDKLTRYSLYV